MPFTQLGYKRIYYTLSRLDGTPRATLILIHGLGGSSSFYYPIIASLVSANYTCLALDLTGAGRSTYTGIEQSVSSLASDVIALMDSLKIPKAVVIGHDEGALVAAELASTKQWRDRIVASVWLGPLHVKDGKGKGQVKKEVQDRIGKVEDEGMEGVIDSVLQEVADAAPASCVVKALVREMLMAQPGKGYISNCRVIANASAPSYKDIGSPVCILAGKEDKSASVEDCEGMLGKLEKVEEDSCVVGIEGCGHWHVLEQPEEVGKEIKAFLEKVVVVEQMRSPFWRRSLAWVMPGRS